MVRAYLPQRSSGSITANTIHTPQGTIPDGIVSEIPMEYEDNVVMEYEDVITMGYEE